MKYGIILQGKATEIVELAQEAETAGWDGVFLADDWTASWIVLTAAAMHTTRIRLGTMLTPLPEQDPWYLAAQTATLDQLSGGRVILTTGLGVLELDKFGMQDNLVRAQQLDEGLDLLNQWWQGANLNHFTYEGKHYRLQPMQHNEWLWQTHTPLQQPRPPIWVVGGPKQTQLRRAARWDGAVMHGTPDEVRDRREAIAARRSDGTSFDLIVEGKTQGQTPADAAEVIRPYAEAGTTWWMESTWEYEKATLISDIRARIHLGPPAL